MTGIIHALAFRHARAALKARAFLPPNPKAREAVPHGLLISSGENYASFPFTIRITTTVSTISVTPTGRAMHHGMIHGNHVGANPARIYVTKEIPAQVMA